MPLDEEVKTSDFQKNWSDQEQRASLLIYFRDGVQVVPLSPGRWVVLGRSPTADVPIPDQTLSRQHARFNTEDNEMYVEDLGSTNGTHVNGERITRSRLVPGDEISLGAVNVCVHLLGPTERQQRGLSSHDRFLSELEDELARCRTYGRKLGLITVRTDRRELGQLTRWCPRVQQLLRPFDRIALYSSNEVEIAVPEASRDDVMMMARSIVEGGGAHEPDLLCGVGLFPDSASSAEGLIEVTRRVSQSATIERPVLFASPPGAGAPAPADRFIEAESQALPVVQSVAMIKIYETVRRVASSMIPVLICGETGTGKEVVARAIHAGGERSDGPMRCINCGAIPRQLIESMLFGHERGAFTGAHQRSKGLFEEASGGTVLLDEIGELPVEAQAALLRVLETMRVTRVGSNKEIKVDVRILAATNRDLEEMCEEQTFRVDLLYRLNTMTLEIPPLRERSEELIPLIKHFVRQANHANKCRVFGVDPAALELLHRYPWPGNVRELRNVIERAVVIVQDGTITPDDLSERVRGPTVRPGAARKRPTAVAPTIDAGEAPPQNEAEDYRDITDVFEIPAELRDGASGLMGPPTGPGREPSSGGGADFKGLVVRFEQAILLDALRRTEWNQAMAARQLQIPLRTLFYKIKNYDLRQNDARTQELARYLAALRAELDDDDGLSFRSLVQRYEIWLIREAMQRTRGKAELARLLQISSRTLNKKLQTYQEELDDLDGS